LPERSLAFGGQRAALAAIGPKAGTGRDQIAGLQRRIIVNIERRETECVFSVAGAVGYQVFTVYPDSLSIRKKLGRRGK
jgi:hypothetical protein